MADGLLFQFGCDHSISIVVTSIITVENCARCLDLNCSAWKLTYLSTFDEEVMDIVDIGYFIACEAKILCKYCVLVCVPECGCGCGRVGGLSSLLFIDYHCLALRC